LVEAGQWLIDHLGLGGHVDRVAWVSAAIQRNLCLVP
jgi:hypothetical protein